MDNATLATMSARIFREEDLPSLPLVVIMESMVGVILVGMLLIIVTKVYLQEYPDVLGVPDDGTTQIVEQTCGGRPIFSVFDFDLCKYLMTSRAAQERVVPPVLFANAFWKAHGTGICTSSGRKHELLKGMMQEMLNGTTSVLFMNVCASSTLQTMATSAGGRTRPLSLHNVESWVTTILMSLIFDPTSDGRTWEADLPELEQGLDDLFEVREELGKLVYDLNWSNSLRRSVEHCRLLYKYNAARETVANILGDARYFKLWTLADIEYTREEFTDEDFMETYIETLLYCKKKLGYAVYKALYEIAVNYHWQVTVKHFLSQPVNQAEMFRYIDDTTEEKRRMLALIFEVLRVSEQRFCCHLRRITRDLTFQVYPDSIHIPKGSVCHLANWSDKRNMHDTFSPASWFDTNDLQNRFNPNVYVNLAPFGKGARECPARKFSCNLIFCLMAHVVRTGRVYPTLLATSAHKTPDIVFRLRDYFSDERRLENIGDFWVSGRVP